MMEPSRHSPMLALARELGGFLREDLGPRLLQHRASGDYREYLKSDGSPVTTGDLLSDRELKAWLARRCPDDLVVSEEDQHLAPALPHRCWLLDPIDGTLFYTTGGEFAIQLALVAGTSVEAAAIYFPRSDDLIISAGRIGAFLTSPAAPEERLAVSRVSELIEARVSLPPDLRERMPTACATPFREGWLSLLRGEIDARVARSSGYAWDIMPWLGALTAAGGTGVSLDGTPISFHTAADQVRGIFGASTAVVASLSQRLR